MKPITLFFAAQALAFAGSSATEVFYFNQPAPGKTAQVFAPGILSLSNRFEQNITLTSDGKEYYYGIADGEQWWYKTILRTQVLADGRIVTDTPRVIADFKFKKEHFIGEPCLSPDGQQLFFVAGVPTHVYLANRLADKEWGEPRELPAPVYSKQGEWHPSVSRNGTLYFASTRSGSSRIYRCAKVNGTYQRAEMLKGTISDDDAGDPCISPDEKHLVFTSERQSGYGGTDICVSHQQADGSWTAPRNLGTAVNSAQEEVGPRLSPDDKYLFFYRRDKWKDASSSDIYWIDISILNEPTACTVGSK